ncbi:MAG: DUF2807 domain-containing protein [Saprospiraceae bacterium]|nr:DUF2807 domain-containing protein [Saprospiraceae bacterium]
MKNITLALTGMLFLVSCSKDFIIGNGHRITEIRSLESFTGVAVAGDFRVNVTRGDTIRVSITGPSNILPLLETEVDGQTLEVGFKSGSNVARANTEISITMPKLTALTFYGNTIMQTKGVFSGPSLRLNATGDGKMTLSPSVYKKLFVNNTGNGLIEAFATSAESASVTVHGNSRTELNVENDLTVRLHGDGRVYYQGDPAVDIAIYGNGKVIKK